MANARSRARPTAGTQKTTGRGARPKKRGPRSEISLTGFVSNHFDAARNAFSRLVAQPFATLMTLLVIGIALALPAGLHLLVQNARLVSGEWANAVDLSVYVTPGTSEDDLRSLSLVIKKTRLLMASLY